MESMKRRFCIISGITLVTVVLAACGRGQKQPATRGSNGQVTQATSSTPSSKMPGVDMPSTGSATPPTDSSAMAVGTTRDVEFTANNPGDWAFHCHKTHHVMNQMGHDLPNLLGVDTKGIGEKIHAIAPDTMLMGNTGMGDMSEMQGSMPIPRNSIPMQGGVGPYGTIDMGGMFTIIKIREGLTGYEDPGWYDAPPHTTAWKAPQISLRQPATPEPAGVGWRSETASGRSR